GGILAPLRRQDLERDEPVELDLPGLVDGAHAALAEQGEDLHLRKEAGQLGRRRRDERTGGLASMGVAPRRGGEGAAQGGVEKAAGTQPFGRVVGQDRAALGAKAHCRLRPLLLLATHASWFLPQPG